MKIMLIEDASNKSRSIISHLKSRGVLEKDIIHAKNMTDFAAHLNFGRFFKQKGLAIYA